MASAGFSLASVPTPLRSTNRRCRIAYDVDVCCQHYPKISVSLHLHGSVLGRHHIPFLKHLSSKIKNRFSVHFADQLRSEYLSVTSTSIRADDDSNLSEHEQHVNSDLVDATAFQGKVVGPKAFKNRFLDFVRLGSVVNNAAESFFKSEIRRRLFVTAALLVSSRIGYFIPLPGFDRRLIPQNYLSFVAGSSDELGDCAPELKMSFFQLGISPQIAASILMQTKNTLGDSRLLRSILPRCPWGHMVMRSA
ncbi:hypothetical protein V2J09_016664 [Rumex salicifolius]